MQFQELKQQSVVKVLFRGKSGRGKTLDAAKLALELSKRGAKVIYGDTEAEGSTTIVNLVERGDYSEEDVENIQYERVSSYDELEALVSPENQEKFDLIIIDTLDHKHSYALREVSNDKRAADTDWNQYPTIYSLEKDLMDRIGKSETNILATLDPDSGKMDKPKGTQTNIHGYFSIVCDLQKAGDDWSTTIRNWVGRSDIIGSPAEGLVGAVVEEVMERVEED